MEKEKENLEQLPHLQPLQMIFEISKQNKTKQKLPNRKTTKKHELCFSKMHVAKKWKYASQ